MERVAEQPGFLLHSRPYRDSSRLCEFFTADHGRVAAVMRGVRTSSPKRRAMQAALQPFVPLSLSWSGRSELKTITAVEAVNGPVLQRERVFSGFYVNEITERLLHRNDPHGELFVAYRTCIAALGGDGDVAPILRCYELALLEALGYGLCLDSDADTGEAVSPDAVYVFHPEIGLRRQCGAAPPSGVSLLRGEDLRDIDARKWHADSLACAKALCRAALHPLLGDKPLRSRELFQRAVAGERA